MSLCSHCVHHCAHTVYVIVLTQVYYNDPVTTEELAYYNDPVTTEELAIAQHVTKDSNTVGSSLN